ncbi:MAG: excinuclease ABC subunit UvrC [Candidatus Woesearchaeota archaeon]
MIKLGTLPANPGCYLFKDATKRVIYVGKAKELRKRVANYFTKKNLDAKTEALVDHIDSVEFFITNNAVEALILENNLIKRNQPKYNINLKDSKRYAYIQITDEDFPKLLTARKITEGKFFGPFVSGLERDYVQQLLIRNFKIRTCKGFPKRPCLRHHINLCDAPCVGHVTKERYNERITRITSILRGKTRELAAELKEQMSEQSKQQNYEAAIEIRDQLKAVESLKERQTVERQKEYNEDIINYIIRDNKVYLLLFNIYKGTLSNKDEFEFDFSEEFLEEFIVQYYSDHEIPRELILPTGVDESIEQYLHNVKRKKVNVTIPKIGEKKDLLELVKKNIEISFFADESKMEELQKKLKLQDMPRVIECFDISHLSGTSTVGSMVQFRNGKPDKSNYRRFKIQSVNGIDDLRAIAEIVRRRYTRLKNENLEMPHLVVIDGGVGQLNFALEELKRLEISIPTISLAKQFEEVHLPGLKFPIKPEGKALRFLQEVRDEAHRFAIKYNRLLRRKEIIG